ncbi:hypothetical protein Avbf_11712, partial [Armadillidium vulgare]
MISQKKKNILKIYWPQEDDQANLEKYDRDQYMRAQFYILGPQKNHFQSKKELPVFQFSMLESASETELDDHSSK